MNINISFSGNPTTRELLELLLLTREGEQALDRNFGINLDCLDEPPELAKSLISQEIIEKINIYFPSLFVESVSFSVDSSGVLIPTVTILEDV